MTRTFNFFMFFAVMPIFILNIVHVDSFLRLSRTYGLHHHSNREEIEKYLRESKAHHDVPKEISKVSGQSAPVPQNDNVNAINRTETRVKNVERKKVTTSAAPLPEKKTTSFSYYDVGQIIIDDEPDEDENQESGLIPSNENENEEYADERRRLGKKKSKNQTETETTIETTDSTFAFTPTEGEFLRAAENTRQEIDSDPHNNALLFYGSQCEPRPEEEELDDCMISSYVRIMSKNHTHSGSGDAVAEEDDDHDIFFCNPESKTCTCLVTDNDKPSKWSEERNACLLPLFFVCVHDFQCEHGLKCLNSTLTDYDKEPEIPRGYPTICKTSLENFNVGNIVHNLNLNFNTLTLIFCLLFFT